MSKQIYKFLCFRRKFKLTYAEAPKEIKHLFDERRSDDGFMSVDTFFHFLNDFQKEKDITLQRAHTIVHKLRETLHISQQNGLDMNGFFNYLFGDQNPPCSPSLGVHHDMTAPLSHYFIYTGHNSYLTGNQLCSNCSDVPIIKALKRGVRVIELDIWPSSSGHNIDVLHGLKLKPCPNICFGTLTSPVKLIKCLRSINQYAFVTSDYPLVITLEDHLTPALRPKLVSMLTQTFGKQLASTNSVSLNELSSPTSLKRKIIISTKPRNEYLGSVNEVKLREEETWGTEVQDTKTIISDGRAKDVEGRLFDMDDEEEGIEQTNQDAVPEYTGLIAIPAGKIKGGLKASLMVDPVNVRRLSINEVQLEKATVVHGDDIIRFTTRNLLRVYPKGTRLTSSNFNPLLGWMHGAQMIAANMQGYGRSLWLMQGMFRANGGCGYVKKPDFMLRHGEDDEKVFNPKEKSTVESTLKVTLYMGAGWHCEFRSTHFDMCSPPDFYARVGIAGVPSDCKMERTKTITDSWTPAWDQVFEFNLYVPELALLRIEVHESDIAHTDGFGGQSCLPFSELRDGIRALPLYDRKGKPFKYVKLLMKFETRNLKVP